MTSGKENEKSTTVTSTVTTVRSAAQRRLHERGIKTAGNKGSKAAVASKKTAAAAAAANTHVVSGRGKPLFAGRESPSSIAPVRAVRRGGRTKVTKVTGANETCVHHDSSNLASNKGVANRGGGGGGGGGGGSVTSATSVSASASGSKLGAEAVSEAAAAGAAVGKKMRMKETARRISNMTNLMQFKQGARWVYLH